MSPEGHVEQAELVTTDAIQEAADLLDGVAVRTPLLRAWWLEDVAGTRVWLKCENLQRAGAFKFRGAYNAVSRLSDEARGRGIITYSSGNHAQAVALAARLVGAPATVVMPTTAPAVKIEGARRFGAEVLFHGTTSAERQERAEAIAAERGFAIVPPFDHPHIIAGQGTVGLEILADCPDVDTVLIPVGGGGLLAGVAAWIKRRQPRCRVIGIEPEGAAAMTRSLAAGRPLTLDSVETIADGLAPVRPGDLTFAHAAALVDATETIADHAIAAAADRILREAKLLVEHSGAATVAALLSGRYTGAGTVVAVLSGGNREPAA